MIEQSKRGGHRCPALEALLRNPRNVAGLKTLVLPRSFAVFLPAWYGPQLRLGPYESVRFRSVNGRQRGTAEALRCWKLRFSNGLVSAVFTQELTLLSRFETDAGAWSRVKARLPELLLSRAAFGCLENYCPICSVGILRRTHLIKSDHFFEASRTM